ncbi:MAG: Sensor histidine kinase [Polyangiaceae bacterium]|jgi:signal transduction histidine kinase|nr:Sensor histidine kinase [Polyangiaceae bacterium]
MKDSVVAQCIRTHRGDITQAWRLAVVAVRPELAEINGELIRYLPDFLERLADSTEADRGRGSPAFQDAARQHALERLGAGASLEELSLEYALLRKVVVEQLQRLDAESSSLEGLVRLNEALDHATELAVRCYDEQLSSKGERFVRLLGHDLRNPLNAASIAAEALTRSEALSARGQKRLSTIARANARMGRLIENMLDFARSYFGGELPLMVEAGDWGEVCRTAFHEVQGENPGRELVLTQDGNLSGMFDRERLRQAVFNMLANAIEHGQDPIELAVVEDEQDNDRYIVTRVTSRGYAIPPVAIKSLDPLVEPKSAAGSNSRLGLFVTSLIARAHGAACEVSSEDGSSSFAVRWPSARTT